MSAGQRLFDRADGRYARGPTITPQAPSSALETGARWGLPVSRGVGTAAGNTDEWVLAAQTLTADGVMVKA